MLFKYLIPSSGYISSLPLTAAELNKAARAHWGIENRLHWVMDVVFHDDLMRLRSQNGPANMALVRHMALNIFKQIEDKRSLKVRRKSATWSEQYLFDALRKKGGIIQAIPLAPRPARLTSHLKMPNSHHGN